MANANKQIFPSGLHLSSSALLSNSFFSSFSKLKEKGNKETHTTEGRKKSTQQYDLNKRFLPSTNWDSITCTATTKNFFASPFWVYLILMRRTFFFFLLLEPMCQCSYYVCVCVSCFRGVVWVSSRDNGFGSD